MENSLLAEGATVPPDREIFQARTAQVRAQIIDILAGLPWDVLRVAQIVTAGNWEKSGLLPALLAPAALREQNS